jgi:hypothetical protein
MTSVYGPRQRPDGGVVAAFAAALSRGELPVLHGDGRQSRDLLFVDDAVDALPRHERERRHDDERDQHLDEGETMSALAGAAVVGIDTYGESAPAPVLFQHFGFTPENVADTVQAALKK